MRNPHPPSTYSSRARRALTRVLLMAFLVTGAACDEFGTDPADDTVDDVTGTWTGTLGDLTVHVRITDSSITVYDGRETACFNITNLTIVSRDGETFELQREGDSGSFNATIRLEGEQLIASGLRPVREQLTMDASDQDLSGFDVCVVTGQWGYEESAFSEYVVVTATSLTLTFRIGPCADMEYHTLESLGPDTYRMTARNTGITVTVTIRNEGGVLALTYVDDGFTFTYGRNQTNLAELAYCGGGDDPGVACGDLPPVDVGTPVAGDLTAADSRDDDTGKYYDLFGLNLASEQQVTISLTADDEDQLDTWLILWTADGQQYAYNDDRDGTTYNSALSLTLPAGCWRIEATSWDSDETGPYTVAVN